MVLPSARSYIPTALEEHGPALCFSRPRSAPRSATSGGARFGCVGSLQLRSRPRAHAAAPSDGCGRQRSQSAGGPRARSSLSLLAASARGEMGRTRIRADGCEGAHRPALSSSRAVRSACSALRTLARTQGAASGSVSAVKNRCSASTLVHRVPPHCRASSCRPRLPCRTHR